MQHGKKLSGRQKQWILAIADKGMVVYGQAFCGHQYMKDPQSMPSRLEIIDGQGQVTRVDLTKASQDSRKEDDHV